MGHALTLPIFYKMLIMDKLLGVFLRSNVIRVAVVIAIVYENHILDHTDGLM